MAALYAARGRHRKIYKARVFVTLIFSHDARPPENATNRNTLKGRALSGGGVVSGAGEMNIPACEHLQRTSVFNCRRSLEWLNN